MTISKVLVERTTLSNIAGAIRQKSSSSDTFTPSEMPQAIRDIPSGGVGEVSSVTITNKSAFNNLSFSGTYLTVPLAVSVLPANAPQVIQVSVSDSSIAKVLNNGNGTYSIHILKGGTCTVTATDYSGNISDTVTFTINQALEDISFPYTSLNVAEGGTRQLKVYFKPSTATDQAITWSSNHQGITVDQNGLVTASQTGSATISAYSASLNKTINVNIEVAAYVDNPDWAYIKAHKENYGVGSEFTDTLTYNNTNYTIVYRVVAQNYAVTKEDGTAASAMIIMATQSLPFTNRFSTIQTVTCNSQTEPTALANTYYYGKNGSTYTKLNVEIGDTLPYSDYDTIYKSGLLFKTGQESRVTQAYLNRWDSSEIRAILNSDANNVSASYVPVHITDKVNYTGKGFLQMINPNLVTVAEPIRLTTVENNSCFSANTYETVDKFWLPSAYQMDYLPSAYDSRPSAKDALEGARFQYYIDQVGNASNSANASRAITNIGGSSAGYYWLRSANYSLASYELCGDSSGALNGNYATDASRFVPACAIC